MKRKIEQKTANKSRGRPEYIPTDEARETVQILRAQGMSLEAIAAALDIHHETLRKHFSVDLEIAVSKKTAAVMMARYRSAIGGSVPAQNKFLELAGALPQKAPRNAPEPRVGKKEQAQITAETAHEESEWGDLIENSDTLQ